MNRSSLRWLLGILVAVLLVAGAGGVVVWLKIAGLKDVLVRDLGTTLGATVAISSLDLDWYNGEIHAAGISLVNQRPDAPWEKGEISQATARFHLLDLFASTLPLTLEVSSWKVVLHPSASGSSAASPEPAPAPGAIRVTHLSAQTGEVEIHFSDTQQVALHGVAFEASDNGANVWTTQLQASSVVSGSLESGASTVEIRGEQDKISFSNLRLRCAEGFITGDGEVALSGAHVARVTLKASDVPVTMLVGVQWQMKLSGLASGDLTYEGDDLAGTANGQLAVNQAKFNVLPWLGKVTALVSLPDITDLELDKATSDFSWKDKTLHLTNLDIRKNDVTRMSGDVTIDATGQVDGRIKLGLPSTVTAKWPQLQDKVFPDAHDDYNWADVHLTGPPDHLQEDLTSRLLAVGVQEGSGILNQTSQKAMDLLKSWMGN